VTPIKATLEYLSENVSEGMRAIGASTMADVGRDNSDAPKIVAEITFEFMLCQALQELDA